MDSEIEKANNPAKIWTSYIECDCTQTYYVTECRSEVLGKIAVMTI
jgi:hypothetical protein